MRETLKYYFLLLSMMLVISNRSDAQEFNYKVNATYVYYFIKYIDWPANTSVKEQGVITIGVLGNSPVIDELQNILSRNKSSSNIVVKNIQLAEAYKCQLVVISKELSSMTSLVREATKNLPIVLVTEKRGLTTRGASICIYIDDEDGFKTKFQISKLNIESRKLQVASELLSLAEVVK